MTLATFDLARRAGTMALLVLLATTLLRDVQLMPLCTSRRRIMSIKGEPP